MSDPTDLSTAIVLYVGFGTEAFPKQDAQALITKFGAPDAARLQEQVEELITELDAIPVDWSAHSLVSAGRTARSVMQSRHPDLLASALDALAWKFTFSWK